jgi:hypothetical protein
LLELIDKGLIDGTSITKETYVVENESQFFGLFSYHASKKRANPDHCFSYTALDEKMLAHIEEVETAFQEIIEKRKARKEKSGNDNTIEGV